MNKEEKKKNWKIYSEKRKFDMKRVHLIFFSLWIHTFFLNIVNLKFIHNIQKIIQQKDVTQWWVWLVFIVRGRLLGITIFVQMKFALKFKVWMSILRKKFRNLEILLMRYRNTKFFLNLRKFLEHEVL